MLTAARPRPGTASLPLDHSFSVSRAGLDAPGKASITGDEVRAAGHPTPGGIEAVVLETDGAFSVVERQDEKSSGTSSLSGLATPAQDAAAGLP